MGQAKDTGGSIEAPIDLDVQTSGETAQDTTAAATLETRSPPRLTTGMGMPGHEGFRLVDDSLRVEFLDDDGNKLEYNSAADDLDQEALKEAARRVTELSEVAGTLCQSNVLS